MQWPDSDFPEDPYPGAAPPSSFVHVDGVSHATIPGSHGWTVDGTDLDEWLATRGAPPSAGRVPVLSYGSNKCPSKITWLRAALGLGADPVVVLRAATTDVAAVWAAGLRYRDGQRPAVLAASPGAAEQHAVWLATPAQVEVLDRCEGRGDRFRLARLRSGTVRVEDGTLVEAPWCYLGHGKIRKPLLVDGQLVRCADVPQLRALALQGEPAPDDGLSATTVTSAPDPDEWPAALFTYGLLQPGQPSWELVAPYAAGEPRRTWLPGQVADTGKGYPAWLAGRRGSTPGFVVPLRDPVGMFPALDEYEGDEYRRIRVALPDGTVCWAYAWQGATTGLIPLPAGWPPA
ncbi:gamma-glutamylcyclotransferase family protein [Pseudonocardia sp. TRM90224]|uniref:gamma-glutamylcyclotransferase family protein n=1 Tax=Pseudonocardia sp. TRM90224 TaxID=2812678 RepID=UPI001E644D3B|nr:gamma-glutamylcyclotransferase [Pseudonocardia sp. TRM90224]